MSNTFVIATQPDELPSTYREACLHVKANPQPLKLAPQISNGSMSAEARSANQRSPTDIDRLLVEISTGTTTVIAVLRVREGAARLVSLYQQLGPRLHQVLITFTSVGRDPRSVIATKKLLAQHAHALD